MPAPDRHPVQAHPEVDSRTGLWTEAEPYYRACTSVRVESIPLTVQSGYLFRRLRIGVQLVDGASEEFVQRGLEQLIALALLVAIRNGLLQWDLQGDAL